MSNEELHQQTVIALARAFQSWCMTEDDKSLLAWHCGIPMDLIKGVQVAGPRIKEAA